MDSTAGFNPVNLDSSMASPVYKGGSGVDKTVSWTFTVDGTAASTNTCLALTLQSESDASHVYMYQVQLEEGSVATPFENRPYGLELSLCQRYYEANIKCGYVGSPFSAGHSYGGTFTMSAKRVLPTFTFAADTNHNNFPNGIPYIDERTLNGFRACKNATAAGGQAYWSSLLNASAEL